MHRRRIVIAIAACAQLLASACAPLAPPATRNAAIALVDVPEPAKLSVTVNKHPAASGSIELTMFFVAEMQTKERLLSTAVRPQKFAAGAVLTDAFAEAFQKPGRSVVRATDPQQDREEFVKDYAALGGNATVYLDIVPRAIGYWAEFPAGSYRPWVSVEFRVYDTRENKIIASGAIGTGPARAGESLVSVAQDEQFAFESFDALTHDPARAVAGLRAGIRQVASALAERL